MLPCMPNQHLSFRQDLAMMVRIKGQTEANSQSSGRFEFFLVLKDEPSGKRSSGLRPTRLDLSIGSQKVQPTVSSWVGLISFSCLLNDTMARQRMALRWRSCFVGLSCVIVSRYLTEHCVWRAPSGRWMPFSKKMEGAGPTTRADVDQSLTRVLVVLAMATDTSAHVGLQRNSFGESGRYQHGSHFHSAHRDCASRLTCQKDIQESQESDGIAFHSNAQEQRTCSTTREVRYGQTAEATRRRVGEAERSCCKP